MKDDAPRRLRKLRADVESSDAISERDRELLLGFDDELAAIHGADVEIDEPEPIGPIECPRCGRDTPRDEPTCMWCDQALSHAAKREIDEQQREVRDRLLRFATDHPELLDSLEDLEPIAELTGGDPQVLADARRFADAVRDDDDG
jgi:hypothetical protein